MAAMTLSNRGLVATLALAAVFGSAYAAIAADKIDSLPGWSAPLASEQYSGFLTVGSRRNLHYWAVMSEGDPANDPVVLWLNGGPGCSSLDGYLNEHGPLHIDATDHSKLYRNPYTWAQNATMIYLESPVGVGFSYSEDPRDYATNDTRTANDAFQALTVFFAGFPELASNDFYVMGESYAGVYVPTLSARIAAGNDANESAINLKGLAVGNGCTGTETGVCGAGGLRISSQYLHNHALCSDEAYAALVKACGSDWATPSAACVAAWTALSDAVGDVDIYNIYGPCIKGPLEGAAARARAPTSWDAAEPGPQECINSQPATDWLNSKDVIAALHVGEAAKYGVTPWLICSQVLNYTRTVANEPRDVYPDLIKRFRVLIYNGDADACVPYIDNVEWTTAMGFAVKSPWRPWSLDKQVAGYVVDYDVPTQFSFLTVLGAGHMVPQIRPPQALAFFRDFIANQPFGTAGADADPDAAARSGEL